MMNIRITSNDDFCTMTVGPVFKVLIIHRQLGDDRNRPDLK